MDIARNFLKVEIGREEIKIQDCGPDRSHYLGLLFFLTIVCEEGRYATELVESKIERELIKADIMLKAIEKAKKTEPLLYKPYEWNGLVTFL